MPAVPGETKFWSSPRSLLPRSNASKAADRPTKAKPKRRRNKPVFEKSFLAIDRQTTLPDETSIDGIGELKTYLVDHRKRDFAEGLTEKILAYALSRDIDYHDEDFVNRLIDDFEQNDFSVPKLIHRIVQSESFQSVPLQSDHVSSD